MLVLENKIQQSKLYDVNSLLEIKMLTEFINLEY